MYCLPVRLKFYALFIERKFNWKMIREEIIYDVAVVKIGDVDKEDVYVWWGALRLFVRIYWAMDVGLVGSYVVRESVCVSFLLVSVLWNSMSWSLSKHSAKILYLFPVWIFGFTISIPCVFSFLSVVVQLESEKDLFLVVLLQMFSSVAFPALSMGFS